MDPAPRTTHPVGDGIAGGTENARAHVADGEGPDPGRRRRRWPIVLACILGPALLWLLLAGRFLVSTQEPVRSDAVVVLSGDPLGLRLRAGAEVFLRTGSTRLVAFVQGPGSVYDQKLAARAFLQSEGVDLGSVRLLAPGASTAQEAGSLAALAERCGWRRIVVVTSPFHTRRAGWLFRQAVGLAVDVRVVANGEEFDAATWWTSDTDTESVLLEWMKLLSSARYLFGGPDGSDPDVPC